MTKSISQASITDAWLSRLLPAKHRLHFQTIKRVFILPSSFLQMQQFISCTDCDLLVAKLAKREKSQRCPRCGKILVRRVKNSVTKALALAISGLLLYLPAMLLPLISLESFGLGDRANIFETVEKLFTGGYQFVAMMVALTAIVFPLLLLGSIFLVSLQLFSQRVSTKTRKLFRFYLHLEEWAMVEIYLLGVLITIIKLVDMGDVGFKTGFYTFFLLVLIAVGISSVIDREHFWDLLGKGFIAKNKEGYTKIHRVSGMVTAKEQGVISCHSCGLLAAVALAGTPCPRCEEKLHLRKTDSITRTWALVLTSTIFFIPANVLPIMQVDFLGSPEPSTVMDGIIYFFEHGSYAIGLIIFTASVLVPLFKIVGLAILLFAARSANPKQLRQKTKMYRFISFIGRWSMLDIFVIALLTALVDFGFFTTINAAPAATYFCMVVIFTMLAAISFDPRIMWDANNRVLPLKTNTQPS